MAFQANLTLGIGMCAPTAAKSGLSGEPSRAEVQL